MPGLGRPASEGPDHHPAQDPGGGSGRGSTEHLAQSLISASSIPLTIVVEGVDNAQDPRLLVMFLRLLAERGSRLLLVFRRPSSESLTLAREILLFDARLTAIGHRITELTASERRLDKAASAVKLAPETSPTSAALRLDLIRLRAGTRGSAAQRQLDDLDQTVGTSTSRVETALRAADAALGRRRELRGRVRAFHARLAAAGRSEDLRVAPFYRLAASLLGRKPCDLLAAGEAVDRFLAAVREALDRPPDDLLPDGPPEGSRDDG